MRPVWRILPFSEIADRVEHAAKARRPGLIALDGRSSSGKSTLAGRLAHSLPDCGLVHTDDLAWFQAVLDWDELLVSGILEPARRGEAVDLRPPAWEERGRPGSIPLTRNLRHLVVEGVGVSRASLADAFDVAVWVETPRRVRLARDRARLANGEIGRDAYRSWMVEENAHLASDRPWRRADLIVCGASATVGLGKLPADSLAVAGPLALGRSPSARGNPYRGRDTRSRGA
jgi:hypothetical protein